MSNSDVIASGVDPKRMGEPIPKLKLESSSAKKVKQTPPKPASRKLLILAVLLYGLLVVAFFFVLGMQVGSFIPKPGKKVHPLAGKPTASCSFDDCMKSTNGPGTGTGNEQSGRLLLHYVKVNGIQGIDVTIVNGSLIEAADHGIDEHPKLMVLKNHIRLNNCKSMIEPTEFQPIGPTDESGHTYPGQLFSLEESHYHSKHITVARDSDGEFAHVDESQVLLGRTIAVAWKHEDHSETGITKWTVTGVCVISQTLSP